MIARAAHTAALASLRYQHAYKAVQPL